MVVSLGNSDWARSWFLVADGETPRPWLSPIEREAVQYIAGRTCAVVIHRDLGGATGIRGMSRPSEREANFAGSAVIKDLLDERISEEMEELVLNRFRVARLVSWVMDGECVFPSHLRDQIPRVRHELAETARMASEEPAWEAVLRAMEAEDLLALGDATLALARHAEAAGHDWSFAQLCSWAYDLAVASRSPVTALAAADAMATACANVSDSDAAMHWARVRRLLESAWDGAPTEEQPLE